MKLKVLRYVSEGDYHQCEDERGARHCVDLFTDGRMGAETHESVVGKVVTCEYLSRYRMAPIQFAMGVSRVEDGEQATQEA